MKAAFFFSDLGVVSLLSQQTVTEKYEFVRSFLRFVLDLPTLEWKCHPMPFAVSLCFSLFSQQHPSGVPANEHNIELQISSSVVKKGKLIHWL